MNKIVSEVKQTLRQADDPALEPSNIKDEAQDVVQNARQELSEGQISSQEVSNIVQQVFSKSQNLAQFVDTKKEETAVVR